jgi:hypothetical protein
MLDCGQIDVFQSEWCTVENLITFEAVISISSPRRIQKLGFLVQLLRVLAGLERPEISSGNISAQDIVRYLLSEPIFFLLILRPPLSPRSVDAAINCDSMKC